MSQSGEIMIDDHEQWEHIEDAKERKKIQNRNAQRAYRERSKRRVEALEQLCQGPENAALLRRKSRCTKTPTFSRPSVGTSETTETFSWAQRELSPVCSRSLVTSFIPPFDETYTGLGTVCDGVNECSGTSPLDLSWAAEPSRNIYDLSSTTTNDAIDSSPEFGVELANASTRLSKESLQPHLPSPVDGQTALHIAAGSGKVTTVTTLLKLSADVLAKDSLGRTALHIAVERSHEAVTAVLVKHKSMLDEVNGNGETALHVSVSTRNEELVLLLLAAGSNFEMKNGNGLTALHVAAMNGNETILKLLLQQGADIDARI